MILDGKKIAGEMYEELKKEISLLEVKPTLGVILVGDDPASLQYIAQKKKWAEYINMGFELCHLKGVISQEILLQQILDWNTEDSISGYLIQLPIPSGFDVHKIIESIAPEKDVDGFHPINQGKLMIGDTSGIIPCTPAGVIQLLRSQKIELTGKEIAIIGRSNIVGKPLAVLLINAGATVTSCNSSTKDIQKYTRSADVVISAAGSAHLISTEDISDNCIVIDVGFNFVDGKIVGDCDFEAIHATGNLITPVPGGVGPMTVAMLMKNTLRCYSHNN